MNSMSLIFMFVITLSTHVLTQETAHRRFSRQFPGFPNFDTHQGFQGMQGGPIAFPDPFSNEQQFPPQPNPVQPQQNQQNSVPQTTQRPQVTNSPAQIERCNVQCRERVSYIHNPVCATNGNWYQNRPFLDCLINCGLNLTFLKDGRCNPRYEYPLPTP